MSTTTSLSWRRDLYGRNAPAGYLATDRWSPPRFSTVSLLTATFIVLSSLLGCALTPLRTAITYNAELEYLKAVNEAKPPEDPRLTFLLMAEFLNANRLPEGIQFFEALLERHSSTLTPARHALTLSALGILRARHTDNVPLINRIGWVKETITLLETARELTDNEDFVTRFATGIVYAQLPNQFGMRAQAYQDLRWLVDNRSKAPVFGLLREVYFQLARLHNADGEAGEAKRYLRLSGYESFEKPITLLTSFGENADTGHTFYPKLLKEIVPGRVFVLSGFEFTEYYFIVSDDKRELVSIDAGTRPDSAQDAYEYLLKRFPHLPPLTTVFFTHAHWDHIGGHSYFRKLNPDVKFYARENYTEELAAIRDARIPFDYFFGTRYSNDFIDDYRPDVTIAERTEVRVGGTRFELIPSPGGETPDGMFIYLPDHEVLFVGDFIMPFIGAPFFEEGNIPGLFEAIDAVVALNPKHILHGHETLTRNWNSPKQLAALKLQLVWLYEQVLKRIRAGVSRPAIHHLNLMPPTLMEHSEVQLVYLIMRENFINRLFDQHVGYWHRDLTGLDHISQDEYGGMLTQYFGLSERRLIGAVRKMVDRGDYHLAGRVAGWALTKHQSSKQLRALRRSAFLKLKEKYQFAGPFKYIIYSEMAGDETLQLELKNR